MVPKPTGTVIALTHAEGTDTDRAPRPPTVVTTGTTPTGETEATGSPIRTTLPPGAAARAHPPVTDPDLVAIVTGAPAPTAVARLPRRPS